MAYFVLMYRKETTHSLTHIMLYWVMCLCL